MRKHISFGSPTDREAVEACAACVWQVPVFLPPPSTPGAPLFPVKRANRPTARAAAAAAASVVVFGL